MPGPGRAKVIIMDKAPEGNALVMQIDLGYQPGGYQPLVDALNIAYGSNVTAAELEPLATVQDVVNYMDSL